MGPAIVALRAQVAETRALHAETLAAGRAFGLSDEDLAELARSVRLLDAAQRWLSAPRVGRVRLWWSLLLIQAADRCGARGLARVSGAARAAAADRFLRAAAPEGAA